MEQKFVIKSPELKGYFNGIVKKDRGVDVAISDEGREAKFFTSIVESKEWLKRINSNEMIYRKVISDDFPITWEIVLVEMKNDFNDFDEVMTWYSTTEE